MESLKEPVPLIAFESNADILHAKQDYALFVSYLRTAANDQHALRCLGGVHCLHPVNYQIQQNLLELHSISRNRGQIRWQFSQDGYLPRSEFMSSEHQNVRDDIP